MIEHFKKDIRIQMDSCIQVFLNTLNTIRGTRVTPAILDSIYIHYHNKKISLNKLSNIVIEDFHTLKINLFDDSIKKNVMKEISSSKLDLNPMLGRDGIIRIKIPLLTEERRLSLIRLTKSIAEKSRISIRNIRKQFNEKLRVYLKTKKISKNAEHSIQNEIQNLTNEYISKISIILNQKEKTLIDL